MQSSQPRTCVGTASQRASAYRRLRSSQEPLLANVPTQPDSELPSYDSLPSPPEYCDAVPQSTDLISSIVRRVAQLFTRRPKKREPVSPEHQVTLDRIARAEDEIRLCKELQSATERERQLESTWDIIAQQRCTSSKINCEFEEPMDPEEHIEALYSQIMAIIGVDIGPQMCLPGAPRAKLVNQMHSHLCRLEFLQRELADCAARTERCEWARICPKYSGMTPAMAFTQLGKLKLWRGILDSHIEAVEQRIAWVDLRMTEMMREYDAMGA